MGVDQVVMRAEPPQRGDDPGHEPQPEEATRRRRLHPAVDLHSPTRLIARAPAIACVTTWTVCPRRASSVPCASACRSAPLAMGWK